MNDNNILAVILAGGKSKRFGEDKNLVKLGSKSLIEHVIDKVREKFKKILIIANKDIKTAIIPIVGKVVPTSSPRTIAAPKKPSITPVHCLTATFSFNNGPARALVKTGLRVTIKAAIPVGRPLDIEKKTPPK